MIANRIWKGDYINESSVKEGEWDYVTLITFEGKEGKCWASLMKENELPFKPKWYSMSLRGYHQGCDIPEGIEIEMKNPVEKWNWRLSENGATGLCDTKEKRDGMLGI